MCIPQGSWPYNRHMPGFPVSGQKAHQSRTFEAIPPLGYRGKGRPSDEDYDSRRKRQKLLRAASIRERINSIRPGLTGEGPCPIDGTIIFPPVDPTGHHPHRDTLIISLEIGDFDVRRILVDQAVRPILCEHRSLTTWDTSRSLENLANPIRVQRVINHILGRHNTAGPSWPSHSQRTILSRARLITLQYHFGSHMASLHESHPFYIPPNGEFSHQRGAD
ncbi:hypothetical protein AAG906_011189 [Vitis piasezkii]